MARWLVCLSLVVASRIAAGCGSPPPQADVATPLGTATEAAFDAGLRSTLATPDAAAPVDVRVAAADTLDRNQEIAAAASDDAAFAPLRALPLTLHYVVNGTPVACQLQDAGVPESDRDFTVACTPEVPWRCAETSALAGTPTRAAPDFWRSLGCYAAHPDGLFYFAACPTGDGARAAFEDPPAAKGVRMLSARMLEARASTPDEEPDPRKSSLARTFRVTGTPDVATTCNAFADAVMMKTIRTATCLSPRYGYVASEAEFAQMLEPMCHDWSALVAVAPGHEPARACAVESDLRGTWRVETRVVVAKNAKALGTYGRYRLTVGALAKAVGPNPCALAARLEKVGINDRDFDAAAIQRADAEALPTPCPPGIGRSCYQIAGRVADAKQVGIDLRFVIAVDGDALTGLWQYEKGSWKSAGLAGTLFGTRGDAAPQAEQRPPLSEFVRCTLERCHFEELAGRPAPLVCPDGARAACLTDTP